jgi:hypothetical protein
LYYGGSPLTQSINNITAEGKMANEYELALKMIQLTWGILVFGLFIIVFIGVIYLKKKTEWDRELIGC